MCYRYTHVLEDHQRPISTEDLVTSYNNYYEFTTSKSVKPKVTDAVVEHFTNTEWTIEIGAENGTLSES